MTEKELFEILAQKDVSDYTEEREGLTYLSWAWAWQEFLKVVPDATYKVKMFNAPDGTLVPYCGNGKMGYMVFTEVSACGVTRECYLPVMDGKNKTMKDEPYTYEVKKYEWNNATRKKEWQGEYEEKTVEEISMFDVNKTIMRCLAKNIAMFGLGLYVYQGQDLPQDFTMITAEQKKEFETLGVNTFNVLRKFGVASIDELTKKQASQVIESKKGAK